MNLKTGDIVDIIAPSSAPQDNQWKKGLKILQSWGLKPRMAKGAISSWLFHSHTNKKRLAFLNQAFSCKDSFAVWMLRGGYGLQKLMSSFIKGNAKKESSKLFIGYSDSTALHLYLNGRNQKTVHAPHVCELPDLSKSHLSHLKNILFGMKKEIVFKDLSLPGKTAKKTLKAPIVGGNLSLLSSSVGTAWFPDFKPHFLFIEDVNEEAHKIDRMLHHLFYSGFLKKVKALLFGYFSPFSNRFFRSNILKSFSDVCSVPMVFGLPCGHNRNNQPLPFKTPARLIIQGDKAELKVQL